MNKLEFSKLNKKEDMILAFNQLKDDYKQLFAINDDLQSKIDKAIEYIKTQQKIFEGYDIVIENELNNLLDILIVIKNELNNLLDILKENK